MENIEKNNSLETAKNRLDISGLTYLEITGITPSSVTKYVYDKVVPDDIDEVYKQYIPIVKNSKNENVLRYKNLMNQYYWLINEFIPSCEYYKFCYKGQDLQWREFKDYSELRGEVIVKFLDFNYKVLSSVMLLKGQVLDNVPQAALPGYTFNGWFTEPDGGEEFDFSNTPINDDLTVFAHYTINTYTIQFVDWNGTVLYSYECEYDTMPAYPGTPHQDGHTFIGWSPKLKPATEDATYTARYKINYYTVKYYNFVDPDESQEEFILIYEESVVYNTASNVPQDPTYKHYLFEGWGDETGGTIDLTHITEDVEVYPIIEPKEYTVTFYNWDNTIITSETKYYGEMADIPAEDPERANYVFVTWDTDTTFVDRNMNVYPIFVGDSRNVYFWLRDPEEGFIEYSATTVQYNTATQAPVSPDPYVYDPYEYGIFDGWFIDSACTEVWDSTTLITEDTVIYGKWKTEFAVTFYNWDGSLVEGQGVTNPIFVEYGGDVSEVMVETLEDNVLPKEGYEFLGWNRATTGITRDTNITAVFSDTQICTVTFVDGVNGETIEAMFVEFGGTIYNADYPEPPEKEHYNFSYWDGETLEVFENITVTAIYEPRNEDVYFLDYNNNRIYSTTAKYLTTGVTPNDISVETIEVYDEEIPYLKLTLEYSGEFYYMDESGQTIEGMTPENTIILGETNFKAQYNIVATSITTCNITFYNYDMTRWFADEVYYGTIIDSAYTENVLEIFANSDSIMDPTSYRFYGWEDQNGGTYLMEDEFNVTEDMRLRALYEAILYSVDFIDTTDGSVISTSFSMYNKLAIRPSSDPTKQYYTFNNWYKDQACTVLWDFVNDRITEDTRIYAKFTGNNYTLSFNTNGGGYIPSEGVVYPSYPHQPSDPSKIGYDFIGWYNDNTTFQSPFDFSQPLTQNKTVYAKWEEISNVYYIEYVSLSDLASLSQLQTMGSANLIPSRCEWEPLPSGAGKLAYDAPITEIPENKFRNVRDLTGLSIPSGVETIGEYAFADSDLVTIYLPDSIESIGDFTFYQCSSLTQVRLPVNSDINYLSEGMFQACSSLENISIPNTINVIKRKAFDGCTSLISITIPNSVEAIGDLCFHGCLSLLYVTLSNNIETLSEQIFSGCRSLEDITIPLCVKYIDNSAFVGCTGLEHIVLPSSIESIDARAFDGCSSLTYIRTEATTPPTFNGVHQFVDTNNCPIYVPDGTYVDYITAWSDYEDRIVCRNTLLYLNDSSIVEIIASELDQATISDVYKNSVVSVKIGSSVTSLEYKAFWMCSLLTSVTIAEGVEEIKNEAFGNCDHITTINIPASVTNIEGGAFRRCTALLNFEVSEDSQDFSTSNGVLFDSLKTKLIAYPAGKSDTTYTIPSSVDVIGYSAFAYVFNLENVTIPNGVIEIGASSFYTCPSLTSLTIPGSVTTIGTYAFYECSGLDSITTEPTTPPTLGNYALDNTNECPIYVPEGTYNDYITAWSPYQHRIVNSQPQNAVTLYLNDATTVNLSDISYSSTQPYRSRAIGAVIHSSAREIDDGAFQDFTILSSVTIEPGLTEIGTFGFNRCSSLTSISIPYTVTNIKGGAFNWCSSLITVDVPSAVTNIGEQAFDSCTSLEHFTIRCTTLPTIGTFLFYAVPTETCVLHVPDGCISLYRNATQWGDFENIVEIN